MRAYITIFGRSIWGLINSLYAVLKQEKISPDIIYIITEDLFQDKLGKIVEGVKILVEEFGLNAKIETKTVAEGKIVAAGMEISNLIKGLKEKGYEIDVDITPGRKSLVTGTILALNKADIQHLFYLDIKTTTDVNYPFEMIPKQLQTLRDFMVDLKEAREHA
nr:hypothetical protein [Candidatus Sigynarchaeota archaeon]